MMSDVRYQFSLGFSIHLNSLNCGHPPFFHAKSHSTFGHRPRNFFAGRGQNASTILWRTLDPSNSTKSTNQLRSFKLQGGAPKIAFSRFTSGLTMVYGRYDELVNGGYFMVYKPTYLSWGPHIVWKMDEYGPFIEDLPIKKLVISIANC